MKENPQSVDRTQRVWETCVTGQSHEWPALDRGRHGHSTNRPRGENPASHVEGKAGGGRDLVWLGLLTRTYLELG